MTETLTRRPEIITRADRRTRAGIDSEVLGAVGGIDALRELQKGILETKDSQAILVEERLRTAKHELMVFSVRWGLKGVENGKAPKGKQPWWVSKGVGLVVANPGWAAEGSEVDMGKAVITVYHTKDNGQWCAAGYSDDYNQKIRDLMASTGSVVLLESLGIAAEVAEFAPDFRYGQGDSSRNMQPKDSKYWRQIPVF